MLNLNTDILGRLPFDPPERKTQDHIAEALSSFDDFMANNTRRISLLEEAARLIFKEWFVHLRFPGHEKVQVVDGVPEGWQTGVLNSAIAINPKTPLPKDTELPFVPMGSLSESSMTISDVETREAKGGAKFVNGDTLLARITPCLENGKTGYVQFLEEGVPGASGSTGFIVMRGMAVPPEYVYCLARSDHFRTHAINSMSGSDGRQRVKPEALKAYELAVPTSAILDEFSQITRPMFDQIHTLSQQNTKLAEARDLLLPRLMDGRITP